MYSEALVREALQNKNDMLGLRLSLHGWESGLGVSRAEPVKQSGLQQGAK